MDVSVSKIDRVIDEISTHTILKHSRLPKSMNQYEFKATSDIKGNWIFKTLKNHVI